ncbi:MAG: solute carrier family 23 protein [Desulfosalsimonas sp.]|uniref:uracil-xanthine permease family protein n=1 Tax=Desulfosalsimonas sp. TaxID=3073848 RepID=UPI0039707604
MAKPSYLIYGRDDSPSFLICLLSGIQHTFVMSSTLILPVVVIGEIGGSQLEIQRVVSMTMIAIGITTMLQSLRGRIGMGHLCPYLAGVPYFAASMQAAWAGGVAMMAGMFVISGMFESLFSRLVKRLRFLFPAEVTGVVVMMVGIALIPLGVANFMGIKTAEALYEIPDIMVGAVTLAVMMGLSVWGTGRVRVYCVFIGLIMGYLVAYTADVMTIYDINKVTAARSFKLPGLPEYGWQFDPNLIFPFIIAALCTSLKAIGDMITCQKISDDQWKQPDMTGISNGLLAGGIGTTLAGILGGVGISTSSSNIGVSAATGTTSRKIGLFAGGLFVAFACLPKITAVFSVMPKPVMGAVLIFVTCYMITAGIQILLTVEMDTQKIFVIGAAIIFGLSADILPDLYNYIPAWLKPMFSSSLTLSTVVAISLTQIFRVGDYLKSRLSAKH